MKRHLILIIIFIIIINGFGFAQQDLTIYMMNNIPQTNLTNPAQQCNCSYNFSGILTLPLYMNISNTGFAYTDFIHHGTGNQSDSLVFDFGNVSKKVQQSNFLSTEFHLNWFSGGYRYKDTYFTFTVTDKLDAKFLYPGDLIKLFWDGNGKSLFGNTADIRLGFNASYYREYAFGTSFKIGKDVTFGIKPKLLFGKANIYSSKRNFTWKTYDTDYEWNFKTDMEVNVSQPIEDIAGLYYSNKTHKLVFNSQSKDFNLKEFLMNRKNFGMALDMGFIYKAQNNLTLYASVVDIGYMKWKTNVNTFAAKGDYLLQGFDVVPFLHKDEVMDSIYIVNQIDSIVNLFDINSQKKSYNSYLTAKVYIGGKYHFNDQFNIGLLTRGEIIFHTLQPSFTLSFNGDITDNFGASLSYSIINRSYKNVGLGLMFKNEYYQFFAVTDNLLAHFFFLSNRNVNFRMGMNITFGCGNEQIHTKDDTNVKSEIIKKEKKKRKKKGSKTYFN